jgi:hypothetical protein
MKQTFKLLTLGLVLLAFSAAAFGQTATATATATILTPITLTRTGDMNFGNIIAGPGGTVLLSPAGVRTPTGVTLPAANPGTVTAATFRVDGDGTSTYAITLPAANYTITRLTGTETMIVNAFTSTPSGTGALTAGTQNITVGATLNVGAAQVPGVYTNAAGFTVSVNYN